MGSQVQQQCRLCRYRRQCAALCLPALATSPAAHRVAHLLFPPATLPRFHPADALRQASRGKALVVPTNAALSTRFVKLGLYKQPGHIPATAIDAFKTLVHSGVAVKRVRETGS